MNSWGNVIHECWKICINEKVNTNIKFCCTNEWISCQYKSIIVNTQHVVLPNSWDKAKKMKINNE